MQHPSAAPCSPSCVAGLLPTLRAGGGDSVKAGPEGEGPPTREEEEAKGEKMQANPAYLPIEMNYESQDSKYINVPN